MSIWPFGRKDSRRKGGLGLKGAAAEPTIQRVGSQREIGRQNGTEGAGIARKRTGRDRRRQSQESNKLQRDPRRRNYSFSPGRSETIGISRDAHRQHPVPPIPDNAASMIGKSAMGTITNNGAKGGRPQDNGVERAPTLYKRSAHDMNRRKSSKKRKEDHDRAAEIKAMSKIMPPPSRASTTPEWSGRSMKRDTKKMPGVSDVSLPIPESLHSSMSSDSERYTSYKLRAIGLFAPHPTIRYTDNPRYKHHESGLSLDRSNSKRKRAMEKESIPEGIATSRMRIDDLADNLDAGGLRELMEREDRRLERKKLDEQQRMARRVARRKEMQKAAEEEAMLHGNDLPKNMDRGVMGRELMGLDVDTAKSSVIRRGSNASSERRQRVADTTCDPVESTPQSAGFVRSESLPATEPGSPTGDIEEPVIATAQLARLSRASMSPPTSPPKGPMHRRNESSISQIRDLPPPPRMLESPAAEASLREDASVEISKTDTARRSFDTGGSSSKQQSSWKSWFKRNSKERRLSAHSSFSNTTRESIVSYQPPPVAYATPLASTIPKRTMSRFREDLPELPISPPSSRVQSPEAGVIPVTPIKTSRVQNNDGGREPIDIPAALRRHDVLFGGGHRSHLRYETSSAERRSTEVPSPDINNFMSQSLASIDSEGSWLSGRPRANSKRSSCQHPLSQPRESHSSLQKRHGESSDSAEELGIAEDEYYSRLTPGPDEMYNETDKQKRVSGNPLASSDEEYGQSIESPRTPELNSKWGDVARRPTVVHRQSRAVSTQGLVNDYLDEDFDDDDETVGSPQTAHYRGDNSDASDSRASPTRMHRATSVDYKKQHMRHISAGSAKLLNLKPRPSGESRRRASVDRSWA